MADDDDDDYKDLQWLQLFVLDVSSWSGTRDQSFDADYVTDFGSDDDESASPPSPRPSPSPSSFGPKSRLEAQVACMKLIACARQPRQVGVVHMGGYTSRVRVDVEPTESWRVKQNAESKLEEEAKDGDAAAVLVDYVPISEPKESSVACPDPRRIVVALRKCKEILQDIYSEKRECNARGSVIITLFLSSPPKGFTLVESDLRAVLREVTGMPHNACMQLVLHPQVFSTEYLSKFGSGVWNSYDTKSDFAPETRCSEQDMEIIERCFGVCLRHDMPDPNILYTVCQYNNYYLSPWCDEKVSMYGRWKECYQRGEDFPQLLWSCRWLHTSFEDWLWRQTGAIAEEFGRAMEERGANWAVHWFPSHQYERGGIFGVQDLPEERTTTTSEFTEEQVKKIESLTSIGISEEAAKKCAAADADDYEVVPTNLCYLESTCNLKEGADVEEVRRLAEAYSTSARASKGVTSASFSLHLKDRTKSYEVQETYNSPDAFDIAEGNTFPHFAEALPLLDMESLEMKIVCDPTEVEFYRQRLAKWGGKLHIQQRQPRPKPQCEALPEERTTTTSEFTEEQVKKIERLTSMGTPEEAAKKCAAADADDYEVVPTNPCYLEGTVNLKEGADVEEVRRLAEAYSTSIRSSKGVTSASFFLHLEGRTKFCEVQETYNSPDAFDISEGNSFSHFVEVVPYLDMESLEMKIVCDPTEVEFYRQRLAKYGGKLHIQQRQPRPKPQCEALPEERTTTTSEFTEEQVKKIERLTSIGIPEEAAKKCAAADADDYEVVPTKPCFCYCAVNLKEGADVDEVRKFLEVYCSSNRASKGVTHNGYTEKDGKIYGTEVYNSPDACEISIGNCFPHFAQVLPHLDTGSMTTQAACDPMEVEYYTKRLAIWGGKLSVIGRQCKEGDAQEHTTVNLSPAAFAEACAKKIKRLTDLGISKEVAKKSADADADDYEVVPTKPCACYTRINLKKGADVDEVRECLKAYSFSANSSKGMILGDYILGDGYIYTVEVWNSPDALDIQEGNALPHFISAQPHLDMESFEVKVVCDPTEVEYYTKRLASWGGKLTVGPSH